MDPLFAATEPRHWNELVTTNELMGKKMTRENPNLRSFHFILPSQILNKDRCFEIEDYETSNN